MALFIRLYNQINSYLRKTVSIFPQKTVQLDCCVKVRKLSIFAIINCEVDIPVRRTSCYYNPSGLTTQKLIILLLFYLIFDIWYDISIRAFPTKINKYSNICIPKNECYSNL